MEHEAHSSADCEFGDVSAVIEGDAGTLCEGPVQSVAGSWAASAGGRRSGAGHRAFSKWAVESKNWRAQCVSTDSGERRGHRLRRIQLAGEQRGRAVSARDV